MMDGNVPITPFLDLMPWRVFMYGQDRKESIPSALGAGFSAFDSGLVLRSSPREQTRDALNLGMLSFRSLRYNVEGMMQIVP